MVRDAISRQPSAPTKGRFEALCRQAVSLFLAADHAVKPLEEQFGMALSYVPSAFSLLRIIHCGMLNYCFAAVPLNQ